MTIEQIEKVDGLGIDVQAGEAVLVISDHLSWQDEAEHFSYLENKIGNYVNFIKSGQMLEILPNARGLSTKIKLVHEHQPTANAERILAAVKKQLKDIEITFAYEALPDSY